MTPLVCPHGETGENRRGSKLDQISRGQPGCRFAKDRLLQTSLPRQLEVSRREAGR